MELSNQFYWSRWQSHTLFTRRCTSSGKLRLQSDWTSYSWNMSTSLESSSSSGFVKIFASPRWERKVKAKSGRKVNASDKLQLLLPVDSAVRGVTRRVADKFEATGMHYGWPIRFPDPTKTADDTHQRIVNNGWSLLKTIELCEIGIERCSRQTEGSLSGSQIKIW